MNDLAILITGFDAALIETFRYWILSQFPSLHTVRTLLLQVSGQNRFTMKSLHEETGYLHIHLVFHPEDARASADILEAGPVPEHMLIVYHERLAGELSGGHRLFRSVPFLSREIPSVSFELCIDYLRGIIRDEGEREEEGSHSVRFTARENEVLDLFAQGMSVKEVAYELSISPYTVAAHQRSLYIKTDSHTLQQLTLFAALRRRGRCLTG